MEMMVLKDKYDLGIAAGKKAGELIRNTISEAGQANIILATGTSQFRPWNN